MSAAMPAPTSAALPPELENPRARFAGLTADSRRVVPGGLFVAVPGVVADGARYAANAEAAGAGAIVAERALDVAIPVHVVPDARAALAGLAAAWFERRPGTIVAVTGTAGKTSVVSFARQLWAAAGLVAAQIGTTGVIAPGRAGEGSLTTPDPVGLHAMLDELAGEGVTHAAMEASSHGLVQRRLDGVRLAAGAFTNLGRDHLDYHADMADYHAAKMRLFDLLPPDAPAVIWADDEWSAPTIEAARKHGCRVLTVGRGGDFLALKRVEHERHRQVAEVVHEGRAVRVALPLAGDFQIANALVAAGLVIGTGGDAAATLAALEEIEGAPGRLELVGATPEGAAVYVDYAHKPEALENVLAAVRPFTTGSVRLVFGCGGDRDPHKRPIMGEIAARLADDVIVTDDNPRSEDPAAIRAAILAAATGAREIGDRGEAIRTAMGELRRGDTLVVAGKGHETGQTAKGVTVPFSDHAVVRDALEGTSAGRAA